MNLEQTLQEAASARPGYTLVSFKEAALPVYVLTATVLVLERKPLGPIDEGVLKAVGAGLSSPDEVSSFLGLPRNVLTAVFAGLNSSELVSYTRRPGSDSASLSLTSKGLLALATVASVVPQERPVKLTYDALTRKVIFVPQAALFKPREVRDYGWLEVPTCSAKRPEVDDIALQDLDKVLARQRPKDETAGELLLIRRIERREMHFLPCTLLFYRSNVNSEDVGVAFWKENGLSIEHERAFRELGGPDQVGARLLSTMRAPNIELAELRATTSTRTTIEGEEQPRTGSAAGAAKTDAYVEVGKHEAAELSAGATLQSLLCPEHPRVLREALLFSEKRLVIISPWIRHQVVDWEFVASLKALLEKGVQVYIGYGLDDEDAGPRGDAARRKPAITPQAERDLKDLESKYKNFRLVYVGNTHRKMLVSDDKFAVVTSFNWLSFRGDPREKPRDEFGTVIRKREYVEEQFKQAMDLLEKSSKQVPKTSGNQPRASVNASASRPEERRRR